MSVRFVLATQTALDLIARPKRHYYGDAYQVLAAVTVDRRPY
jgi:hypothetical protein